MKPYPETPDGLVVEHDGPILRMRLDRPERRNAITDPIVYALVDLVDAASSDEGVRVIHLSGNGDHFCSGFDLGERTPGPRAAPGRLGPPPHARPRQPADPRDARPRRRRSCAPPGAG